jgi:hypothetical protein
MGIFQRLRGRSSAAQPTRGEQRAQVGETRRHLEEFVRSRVGVEAYLEPATRFIPPTVLLIASSGEWTRRRVPDPAIVRGLADGLAVPVYDVRLVGYPQRMRDWNERVKRGQAAGSEPRAADPGAPEWGTPG